MYLSTVLKSQHAKTNFEKVSRLDTCNDHGNSQIKPVLLQSPLYDWPFFYTRFTHAFNTGFSAKRIAGSSIGSTWVLRNREKSIPERSN